MTTLSPTELLPTRPFTHPDHTSSDLKTLLYMLERVCVFIEFNRTHEHLQHPVLLPEPDGRAHRYIIPNPIQLLEAHDLAVVGFFGHKRPDATPDHHFGSLGDTIMRQIPSYRDILGYSNMALDDDNFSNLVLLRNETVKQVWLEGEAHTQAVSRSPGYYATIRIYNGTLAGVAAPQTMHLTNVKYYDFQTEPYWRAERSLT